jgi:hypothetical protein
MREHPFQVSGVITRRSLLAHLFLVADTQGGLPAHPSLAPTQVAFLSYACSPEDELRVRELVERLSRRGIRVSFEVASTKESLGAARRKCRVQSVPVEVFIRGRRTTSDALRVVMTRADTRQEAAFNMETLEDTGELAAAVLTEVGDALSTRISDFVRLQQVRATSLAEVKEITEARRVAVVPLTFDEASVRHVEAVVGGEVLSFSQAACSSPCIASGRSTPTAASISPRL